MGGGRAPAFTLIELLVVVAIIALLISILLPGLSRARASAKLTKCAANLKNIGAAIALYQAEHDSMPWLQECDNDPQGGNNGGRNDVYAVMDDRHDLILENLNLLVAQRYLVYDQFICPARPCDYPPRTGTNKRYGLCLHPDPSRSGFALWYIDYGYHLGTDEVAGVDNPAAFDEVGPAFAIMADADVGDREKLDADWSHKTTGVNVLCADWSVSFVKPDAGGYILVNGDNIYNNGEVSDDSGRPDAAPVSRCDQVIFCWTRDR